MSIDTFTTAALADELNEHLAGGRIQDTVELDRESFGLEVYANQRRHYLLLCADNQQPRALLVPDKLRRGVQMPSPLGLLLRTRVEGMRLQAVRQPPWERILIFDLLGEDTEMHLIIEMIARRANLLLVENDIVLDCARRVGPDENRYRVSLPRHPYVSPPPMEGKIKPENLLPMTIETLLRKNPEQEASSVLLSGILGFSPLLAKEAVYRAYKRTDVKAGQANPYSLHAALESFLPKLIRRQWHPGVMVDEDELPLGISVFPVTHLGTWQPTDSVSAALNAYYGELAGLAAYEAARKPIREQLKGAREKVSRRLEALERELVDQSEIEILRKSGELLLAYQYSIQPKQDTLVAEYDVEGEPLTIKLDPALTPLENAQHYFERYEKKKRARDQLPERIAEARHELEYLDQLGEDLTMGENWQDIGEVQDALQRDGYWQGKQYAHPKGGKSAPLKVTTSEGFPIYVGRNSRQNEELLHRSEAHDLWLHARDVPGSHVIIKTNARAVPAQVLERAAQLAAYYSKLRGESKVLVQVAECRHVHKMKGGKTGQVTIHRERDGLTVKPVPVEDD